MIHTIDLSHRFDLSRLLARRSPIQGWSMIVDRDRDDWGGWVVRWTFRPELRGPRPVSCCRSWLLVARTRTCVKSSSLPALQPFLPCPRHPPPPPTRHTHRTHTLSRKQRPSLSLKEKSWLEAIKAGVLEPAVDSLIIEPSQPTCRSQLGCSIAPLHRNHSVRCSTRTSAGSKHRSNSRRNQRIRLCRVGLIRR